MKDIIMTHKGFQPDIKVFTDESIDDVKKDGFRNWIIPANKMFKNIPKKEKIFDVFITDKSGLYGFIWDNKKYFINIKHDILFEDLIEPFANIDDYGIVKEIDLKHSENEKRWAFYVYTISKSVLDNHSIGFVARISYTMRRTSLRNDGKNYRLILRFISARYFSRRMIKKHLIEWWKERVIDMNKEDLFEKSSKENLKKFEKDTDLYTKRFYIQIYDVESGKQEGKMVSLNDLKSEDELALIRENNLYSSEDRMAYRQARIDWCKMYTFDPEIDSYDDDLSKEAINRIGLYNRRNSIAFNQSINNLREAGIHLPDMRFDWDMWPEYETLRELIESGGDQQEILRLFPIVFAEYVVMPGDVDLNDPEIERFTTLGGHFPYVYMENSLPLGQYTSSNPWNIEIGKQWLKDRQMALLENKDR